MAKRDNHYEAAFEAWLRSETEMLRKFHLEDLEVVEAVQRGLASENAEQALILGCTQSVLGDGLGRDDGFGVVHAAAFMQG